MELAQRAVHACVGFMGNGETCVNCGHPRKKHSDSSLNSAGHCRECVSEWKLSWRDNRQDRYFQRESSFLCVRPGYAYKPTSNLPWR